MRSTQVFAAALVLAAAAASGKNVNESSQLPAENPFARESTLPYRLPPLDKIKDEHFKPALLAGMADQRKEIDAIAKNSAPPTFENTVVAMERSGQLLTRVSAVFGNLSASNTNPQIEALQTEMSPKLSAHSDAIYLDPALFGRVRTLYEQRASLQLDPESLRLLERYNTNFVRAGARLSDADKTRLKALNEAHDRIPANGAQGRERGRRRRRLARGARRFDGRADRRRRGSREGAQARR
jgi:peptidyl-dipeptidase Dcp